MAAAAAGNGTLELDPVWDDMDRTLGQLFMASLPFRCSITSAL
ncbi:hypothetical protein Slin15195_G084090 [Septoria linicola]|uniref:Uncharacterized protein n=1 Tax=Septoria linicola TaxID=215465 RepID=A0A9Q9AYY4_9PEZI|nr:hypothetical protein Slin14017_G086620 [Septoria linicola]USW55090.1 hypothetical protein Slin15195_G084090 [Septoria linicola]